MKSGREGLGKVAETRNGIGIMLGLSRLWLLFQGSSTLKARITIQIPIVIATSLILPSHQRYKPAKASLESEFPRLIHRLLSLITVAMQRTHTHSSTPHHQPPTTSISILKSPKVTNWPDRSHPPPLIGFAPLPNPLAASHSHSNLSPPDPPRDSHIVLPCMS